AFFLQLQARRADGVVIAVVAYRIAQQVRQASGHASAKVNSGSAQDDGNSRCHIFAAMLADALDYSQCAAIAHRETLSGLPGKVEFARSRTVQNRVSREDISTLRSFRSCTDGYDAAGEAFADIVIPLTGKAEINAGEQEGAEALPCC